MLKSFHRFNISLILILFLFIHSVVAQSDSLNVLHNKVYKIGLPNVPGVMWRAENGEVKGFALELFEQIALDEGIKFEWIEAPWPKLYELILKGEIDALPGTQESEERLKKLDFIDNTLYTMWSELLIREQNNFNHLSELSGKKIGLVIGDNNAAGFEKYIDEFEIEYTKVELISHEKGTDLLMEGELYAMVTPSFYFKERLFDGIKHAGLFFNPSNLKISFPKNKNQELRLAIDHRLSIYKQNPNSIYNKLFVEYGLANLNIPYKFVPKWLIFVLISVIVMIVIGVVFIVLLRKQVQVKTQNLNQREIFSRRTMELGNMGTWHVDVKNWEIEWSRELYDILGYPHDKKITFNFLREIVENKEVVKVTHVLFDSIRLHKNFDIEFKICKSDGSMLYTRQIGVVYSDEDGNTSKIFGIMQNVTQQKKHDRQLIKAKEKAEESERLKSVFLANMSHEIRTPLNAIIGFSTLVAKGNVEEEKRKSFLSIIEKQNSLLLNLISDIIDFAKIESKSLTLTFIDHVDLDSVINEIHDTFLPHCPDGVDFKVSENKFGTKILLRTDVIRLKQVISNLVINAFKYTNEGFVEVGYRVNSAEDRLDIFVKDTGIGIPEEHKTRVFERFHQVNELAQGTGLGLAICSSLSQMLGGKVVLKESNAKGSEFVVELPYSMIQSAGEELYETIIVEGEIDIDAIPFEGIEVLAAEDIDSNYLYLNTVLGAKGIKITRAHNGKEAIQLATANDYDLILMDIKMPILDGLEAARSISTLKPKMPIIAVTAYAFDADRAKAIEAGCTDYISKPVDREELLELMANVLKLV